MTRYGIGDVQGCFDELQSLLHRLAFSSDRDQLWFVGDLVNRGPQSLEVLRFVRSLGDNARVVLGNHDLHLLAVAFGVRRNRKLDTLDAVLEAPDRNQLLEWLIARPLAHLDVDRAAERVRADDRPAGPSSAGRPPADGRPADLMVHAGLIPQWSVQTAMACAREVEQALQRDPAGLFEHMYGDDPDRWRDDLPTIERQRFTINVLTRLRVCTADGHVDLKWKGKPQSNSALVPWFDVPERASRSSRVIFGHWSALGYVERNGVVGLDSGCVWGGALTAFDLDTPREPFQLRCPGHQLPDD